MTDFGVIRFCPQCGTARRTEDSRYCTNCGESLSDGPTHAGLVRPTAPAAGSAASVRRVEPHANAGAGGLNRNGIALGVAAVLGLGIVLLTVVIVASRTAQTGPSRPSVQVSRALLDYFSASGIKQSVFCSDLESGVGPDTWAEDIAQRTGLTPSAVRQQAFAWCGMSQ